MTDFSWNSWNPKGSFTQAIFVAATRCNFCRAKAATSFKHRVRKTPAISRRQIALKIAPALQVRFCSCNFRATKIASNCRDKNRLCKWALTNHNMEYRYYKEERSSSHILPLFSIPKCVDYAASLSSVLLSSYCRHSSSVVGCRSSVRHPSTKSSALFIIIVIIVIVFDVIIFVLVVVIVVALVLILLVHNHRRHFHGK